jgi:hypothetical protein
MTMNSQPEQEVPQGQAIESGGSQQFDTEMAIDRVSQLSQALASERSAYQYLVRVYRGQEPAPSLTWQFSVQGEKLSSSFDMDELPPSTRDAVLTEMINAHASNIAVIASQIRDQSNQICQVTQQGESNGPQQVQPKPSGCCQEH